MDPRKSLESSETASKFQSMYPDKIDQPERYKPDQTLASESLERRPQVPRLSSN